jgi:hypothetical protein
MKGANRGMSDYNGFKFAEQASIAANYSECNYGCEMLEMRNARNAANCSKWLRKILLHFQLNLVNSFSPLTLVHRVRQVLLYSFSSVRYAHTLSSKSHDNSGIFTSI